MHRELDFHKFDPAEMNRLRRIPIRLEKLSDEKMRLLLASSCSIVFDKSFVRAYPRLTEGVPLRSLHSQLGNIRSACDYKRVQTLRQFLDKGYMEMQSANRMGPWAMAFALDLVTMFGLEMKGVPKFVDGAPTTGADLAKALKR